VATPACPTIADLAAFLHVPKRRTAKAVLMMAAGGRQEPDRFVFAVVRGDRDISERKLATLIPVARLRPATEEEIRAAGAVPGYASPVGLPPSTFVIVDEEVARTANLVAGANESGYHLLNTNAVRDYRPSMIGDIARAADGDGCPSCGAALKVQAGVMVGGLRKVTSRSDGAGASFQDRDGRERPLFFGRYELALDRLLACIAEEHHDDKGLLWPARVAPFAVHLVSLGAASSAAGNEAERLYRELEGTGRTVLFDDRDERPGVKFADADLIGAPVRLTVSERSLQAGGVEMKLRGRDEREIVPAAVTGDRVTEELRF
jgi:prolyl-tRNA synthetase